MRKFGYNFCNFSNCWIILSTADLPNITKYNRPNFSNFALKAKRCKLYVLRLVLSFLFLALHLCTLLESTCMNMMKSIIPYKDDGVMM